MTTASVTVELLRTRWHAAIDRSDLDGSERARVDVWADGYYMGTARLQRGVITWTEYGLPDDTQTAIAHALDELEACRQDLETSMNTTSTQRTLVLTGHVVREAPGRYLAQISTATRQVCGRGSSPAAALDDALRFLARTEDG